MDGGRLRLIDEYEVLAAVDDEAIDDIEMRFAACAVRRSSGESVPPWRGGRSDDVRPGLSGIADSDDIVMLGLGGSSDEVDDEGDTDPEPIDARFVLAVGTSGSPVSGGPAAGGSLLERRSVLERAARYGDSPGTYVRRAFLLRLKMDDVSDSVPDDARTDSWPDVACDSPPESLW